MLCSVPKPKRKFKDCIEESLKIKGLKVLMQKTGICGEGRFAPVTLVNQEKPVEEEEEEEEEYSMSKALS